MRTALMVAEKPSLAAALAAILSNKTSTSRKGTGGCCVHEWKGFFFSEQVLFRMTSVCGHVFAIDFNGKFNNWNRVDPLELFDCPTERKESTPKLRIPSFLAQEAKSCDYLVLWLDCDREGENICFEVIDCVKNSFKRPYFSDNVVWRARFSAVTDKDIKLAMMNLSKPNKNEALSVDARQELDLRIGCAFTRYQTKFFQNKYGNLDSSLISFGPCQTPTLGFCVLRHDEIQSFKPVSYWELEASVTTKLNHQFKLSYHAGRIFERDIATQALRKVENSKTFKVSNVTAKEKFKPRPVALNTVELMRVASSKLSMSPQHAMNVAERLYALGYVSYPRTETTSYSENYNLLEVVELFRGRPHFGEYVTTLLEKGINRPRKGKDVGDHPPITPMRSATKSELDGELFNLYEYIVRHFFATLYPDCRYLSTTTTFESNAGNFFYTGDVVNDPGFMQVLSKHSDRHKAELNLQVGDEVTVDQVIMKTDKTKPPDYLTESELISKMEEHGIGTDASIPVHINNICQRNYVSVGSGRRLIPTNLGIVLVHGYQKIDIDLVDPSMRSKVEKQLNAIARGEADYKTVLFNTTREFREKFEYFVKNVDRMDNLFEVSFTPLAQSGKPMSRCGRCRRYMKYIQARPHRLHCAHCDQTYNLPQNGNIRVYKQDFRCPIDDFEVLTFSSGAKGKSFQFCPFCYNDPVLEDECRKYGTGCNNCLHEKCSESLFNNGIANCAQCEEGVLVLEPSSAPRWKVVCNACDIVMTIFENALKVTVDKKECELCFGQCVKVEYKEESTQLPGDRREMTQCMFCFAPFKALVKINRAVSSKPAFTGRRNRGRGGKKSRRGRNKPPKDTMAKLDSYFV